MVSRGLKPEGRAVRAATGAVRWTPADPCPLHRGEHYTASGRCVECTRLAKEPAKQAAYWAEHADVINRKRREQRRGRSGGGRVEVEPGQWAWAPQK